jgi:F-type H+-transporting ATPase subunit gamma
MMRRLADIESHIGSMSALSDIVGAMRALASMRIEEAHRALPGVRRYAEAMAAAIGSTLLLLPERTDGARQIGRRRALVLCAAEHGFVGGFNERLLAAADTVLGRRDLLFVLGSRGAALARERGRAIAWTQPMPTRLESAPEAVRHLTADLYPRIARGEVTQAEAMFARYRQGSAATVERRPLFPLDFTAFAVEPQHLPPLHNLTPAALLEKLVGEYIFALLTEAATESLASENAARFGAMEAAHRNVANKLEELRREAHQVRQDEITTELLDVVTGAEAIQGATAGPCP